MKKPDLRLHMVSFYSLVLKLFKIVDVWLDCFVDFLMKPSIDIVKLGLLEMKYRDQRFFLETNSFNKKIWQFSIPFPDPELGAPSKIIID